MALLLNKLFSFHAAQKICLSFSSSGSHKNENAERMPSDSTCW